MGRASRKGVSSAEWQAHLLEQYRQQGWSEEALDASFMTGGGSPAPSSHIFSLSQGLAEKFARHRPLTIKERSEVLLRADTGGRSAKDFIDDPIFQEIYGQELNQTKDLLRNEEGLQERFAEMIIRSPEDIRAPRLLEAAAENDEGVFQRAAEETWDRIARGRWSGEECASLPSLLHLLHTGRACRSKNLYIRALLDGALYSLPESWPADIPSHFRYLSFALARGGASDPPAFSEKQDKQGLDPQSKIHIEALEGLARIGIFERMPSESEIVDVAAPIFSKQLFSLTLGRDVASNEEAAQELAEKFFFPGAEREMPWKGLRALFLGEQARGEFGNLYNMHLRNRVFPTRSAELNAENLVRAVDIAARRWIESGPEPGQISRFLVDALQEKVYR